MTKHLDNMRVWGYDIYKQEYFLWSKLRFKQGNESIVYF